VSRKGRRIAEDAAWAHLLGLDLGGITELEKLAPERVDGVAEPATGAPVLLLKSAAPGKPAPGGLAEAEADLLGYALMVRKSGTSGEQRWRAEDMLDRFGIPSADLLAKAYRPPDGPPERRLAGRVVKAEAERRYSLMLAYPAYRPDAQVALDGHRDVASAAAVESGAWDYLAKHRQVGLWHQDGTTGAGTGTVVESYIYRPDKPWVVKCAGGETFTVRQGDWLVGIVWSDEPGPGGTLSAWSLVKTGKIRGVSMQGTATRRAVAPETLARMRERGVA